MVFILCALRFQLVGTEELCLSVELQQALRSIDLSIATADAYQVHFSVPPRDASQPASPFVEIDGVESGTSCGLRGVSFDLSVEWAEKKITAMLRPQSEGIDQSFLKCLNAIICLCLVQHRGLAVHAACVCLQNSAVLIAGRSGAGKSTLAARLSPPGRILDDDFAFVYLTDGRYWVTSSPFGKDGRIHSEKNASFPLEKIFFIRKAVHAANLPLSIPQAYRSLAQTVFAFLVLPRISSRLLDTMHLLCMTIPMYLLHADPTLPNSRYVSLVFKETP